MKIPPVQSLRKSDFPSQFQDNEQSYIQKIAAIFNESKNQISIQAMIYHIINN